MTNFSAKPERTSVMSSRIFCNIPVYSGRGMKSFSWEATARVKRSSCPPWSINPSFKCWRRSLRFKAYKLYQRWMANNNLYKTIGQLSVCQFSSWVFAHRYTCKKITYCSKSANKPSTSCAPIGCQQVVLPSYQQVWNNLLTTCNNFVDIIRFVCCKVVPIGPIQSWYNNIVNLVTSDIFVRTTL